MHKVYLKPGKEESLKRFHPWIFSGAIARFDGEPEEGEVVEVYTSKKEFIAEGHFQIGSIAVRVLSFRQEPIDHDFWKRKLQIAYDMRCGIGIAVNPTNDTYRLVHGEGDNLPGLVIDIYARTAVMQAHSAGMHVDRMSIAEALSEVMGDKIENIYYKSETTLPFKVDLLGDASALSHLLTACRLIPNSCANASCDKPFSFLNCNNLLAISIFILCSSYKLII